jgi:hypothetical protein
MVYATADTASILLANYVAPQKRLCVAANAIKALWYAPLQAELAKRGRFMAKFHREAMAPKSKGFGGVFNGVTIDLNGLGKGHF